MGLIGLVLASSCRLEVMGIGQTAAQPSYGLGLEVRHKFLNLGFGLKLACRVKIVCIDLT